MSELVKLVNEWDHFEKEHPQSSIEDFCRYFLIRKKQEENALPEKLRQPPNVSSYLAKTLGRIAGIMDAYFKIAYRGETEVDLEAAFFLNSVYLWGEARKSDIIHYNFTEQSTGIDILNRLKKAGLITERDDPDDKRAKLVKVTPKGEEKVFGFWERANKIALIIFAEVSDDDKKLVSQLLGPVEAKHTKLLPEVRQKNINEILEIVLGPDAAHTALDEIETRMNNNREQIKK